MKFVKQAHALALVARELDDPELHRACDSLSDVAVEADEVDARFRARAEQVKALLTARMAR